MPRENAIPLTLDEHRELGREMKATTQRLRTLCALVADVYGPHNRAAFTFHNVVDTLDRLNQELAAQAAEDLRGEIEEFYR